MSKFSKENRKKLRTSMKTRELLNSMKKLANQMSKSGPGKVSKPKSKSGYNPAQVKVERAKKGKKTFTDTKEKPKNKGHYPKICVSLKTQD